MFHYAAADCLQGSPLVRYDVRVNCDAGGADDYRISNAISACDDD